MFKRVEKRRKKREEEEELGLDEDTKDLLGLHDTDSAESDTGSESDMDPRTNDDVEEEEAVEGGDESEPGDRDEEPPISVEEALKDPVYLISFEPTTHGCILCKGKIIKNAQMATTHRDSAAHKRRYERFMPLALAAAPGSNAWDVVKTLRAQGGGQDPQSSDQLSNRALKRQAKQATLQEKRRRHKELKAKAVKKKAEKKVLEADAGVVKVAELQSEPRRPAKRPKFEQKPPSDISKHKSVPRPKGYKKSQKELRREVNEA